MFTVLIQAGKDLKDLVVAKLEGEDPSIVRRTPLPVVKMQPPASTSSSALTYPKVDSVISTRLWGVSTWTNPGQVPWYMSGANHPTALMSVPHEDRNMLNRVPEDLIHTIEREAIDASNRDLFSSGVAMPMCFLFPRNLSIIAQNVGMPSDKDVESLRTVDAFLAKFAGSERTKFDASDLDKKNLNGSTPITVAVERGDISALKALLNLGANPALPNEHGNTALSLAGLRLEKKGKRDALDAITARAIVDAFLLKYDSDSMSRFNKFDLNASNIYGSTPLTVAAEKKKVSVVKALVSLGANTQLVNGNGYSAVSLARHRRHKDGMRDVLTALESRPPSSNRLRM